MSSIVPQDLAYAACRVDGPSLRVVLVVMMSVDDDGEGGRDEDGEDGVKAGSSFELSSSSSHSCGSAVQSYDTKSR